ncbi:Acid phosphatase PHO1 [Golovinomyces cichoracearum]|uniref:Acid phosphatase PHO1 n=1 Tax=Golovinomyces cichoracearum TaxID=62708 RepID=A0A420H7K1_9PEZI|nr:Acid phosphatase PHO1 [Golovinomyces cichoracearum]
MLALLFLFNVMLVACAEIASRFDPLRHLSGVSPPNDYESTSSLIDPDPPRGCNVVRAAYLVRHGAIQSNEYEYKEFINPFLIKLANSAVDWSSSPDLAFLSTWKAPNLITEWGVLSNSGKVHAMGMGLEITQRYPSLRTPKKIWTTSAKRTVKSAKFFAKGMATDSSKISVVTVNEGKKDGANTLAPYESCPAYSKADGSDKASKFIEIYTKPVISRLNSIVPGFNFTAHDIHALSLICGYETVIRGSSPFCKMSVLSTDEWLGFEYSNDIRYFYNSGYGSTITGAVGFPWMNSTFNRLMSYSNAQSDETADQDLFISFTHRNLPPMVMVAMGLFNNSAFSGANEILSTMPLDTINHQRVWKSSQIIPFLTDIGIEKLECDSHGYENGTYYRVMVNHNPQSIPDCHDGPGESCKEASIVKWLPKRAKIVGDFDTTCKVNYDNSTNILSIYD